MQPLHDGGKRVVLSFYCVFHAGVVTGGATIVGRMRLHDGGAVHLTVTHAVVAEPETVLRKRCAVMGADVKHVCTVWAEYCGGEGVQGYQGEYAQI